VRAVALGDEALLTAIELHAAEMQVIGVLLRVVAAGPEPQLAIRGIQALDAAHTELTAGDLAELLAGLGVEAVDVVPAAALGHPEELVALGEPTQPALVGVVEEGLDGLVKEDAHALTSRVDGEDPHHTMPAFVVDEGEARGVLRPAKLAQAPRGGHVLGVEFVGLAPVHVDQPRAMLRDRVARFDVVVHVQLGLQLALGADFDERDLATLGALDAHHDRVASVGRAADGPFEGMAGLADLRKADGLLLAAHGL
jgi:hypothetical protein